MSAPDPLAAVLWSVSPYLIAVLIIATAMTAAEEYAVRSRRRAGTRPYPLAITWILITVGWALGFALAALLSL